MNFPPPNAIRSLSADGVLELAWEDRTDRVPFRLLRIACPCAACVSETTGERLLDPATVPRDITPAGMTLAGNYALRPAWPGGHDTGLFTWPYLREIGAATAARAGSAPAPQADDSSSP